MDNPLYYRNKAQYPIRKKNSKILSGFYSNRSHEIIPMDICPIQIKANDYIKNIVQQFTPLPKRRNKYVDNYIVLFSYYH